MTLMGKVAYTLFVAFVASLLTLVAVFVLSPDEPDRPTDGTLLRVTARQLTEHNRPESCWKAIHGLVYDVTDYILRHPTPPEVMYEWCGKDATQAWDDKGIGRPHSPRAEALLKDYLIGVLVSE
jgi:cytochrome b involved in lipid metabolism